MIRRPIPAPAGVPVCRGANTWRYFASKLPAKARGGDDLSPRCTRYDQRRRFSDGDIINHMIFFDDGRPRHNHHHQRRHGLLAKHPEWQGRAREESASWGRSPDIHGLERLRRWT